MFRMLKTTLALPIICALLLTSEGAAMADTTLIHDDFRVTTGYNSNLNTGAATRQYSAAGLAPMSFIDNRSAGNTWELALASSVPEAVKMAVDARYDNPLVFGFNKDWKSYDAIRVWTRMIPAYHLDGYLNRADTWVGVALAGGSLKAAGAADAVSFKIAKDGSWAAYNYSSTPFVSGNIAGVTDPAINALEYELRAELRKAGSNYLVSFSIRSRVYDDLDLEAGWGSLTDLVSNQVVAGSFATNYVSWSGGVTTVEWPYTACDGVTDVIVEQVTVINGTLNAHIDLDNYSGSKESIATKVEFIQGNSIVQEAFAKLDASGNCIVSNVPPGTYDVAFKPGQFVRKVVPNVTIPPGGVGSCSVSVLNGDVDGDGDVTTTDVSATILNLQ